METYNGWTNRETWLFGLHYGEILSEAMQTQEVTDEAELYSLAEALLFEADAELETALEHVSGFVADVVSNDIHKVDLDDIVDTYKEELEEI